MKTPQLLSNLTKDKFLISRSIIVVAASIVANVFSYLFQLISGRYLSVEDYSVLVSLFALSVIIPIFVLIYSNGIPKLVAEIKDKNYPDRFSSLFFSVFKLNVLVSVLTFLALYVFLDPLANYLQIANKQTILIFALSVCAGIISSSIVLFTQGLMRFKAYSFLAILGAFGKFASAILVMLLGLGVTQIFSSLAITSFILIIIGILVLRKNLVNKVADWASKDIQTLMKYSFKGAFALIGMNLLNTIDVIQVKHFFDATTAGIYSSISIVGRIIFFAASPVSIVILPICASKYKKRQNYTKPFLTGLALTFFIAGSGALVYNLFPELVIKILFGEKYLPAVPFLPQFAIFMLLYSILTITLWFLIGVSKFKLASLSLMAAAMQFAGLQFFHNSITQVITVSIVSVGTTLAFYSVLLIPILKRENK